MIMKAIHSQQPPIILSLSFSAINCLLCISTCLAAFCPATLGPSPSCIGGGSDCSGLAFVSVPHQFPVAHHQSSTFDSSLGLQQGQQLYLDVDRRRKRSLFSPVTALQASSTPDNDDTSLSDDAADESQNNKSGVRARVRQSVTQASQKVKTQLSYLRPNIITKGGAPIAGVLTDAAVTAAELAAEEVRLAALDVLQRGGGKIANNGDDTTSSSGSNSSPQRTSAIETQAQIEADAQVTMDTILLAKTSVADAFDMAERAVYAAESEIQRVRAELEVAKRDATLGLAMAEKAAAEAAGRAERVTESVVREVALLESLGEDGKEEEEEIGVAVGVASSSDDIIIDGMMEAGDQGEGEASISVAVAVPSEEEKAQAAATTTVMKEPATTTVTEEPSVTENEAASIADETTEEAEDLGKWSDFDESEITYDDVDYTLTDMAPPFINEDECLVPGEPVVRVEKAPQNSRRIFAGIDIPVSVDDVWELLTDYPNLQKVVPNLVVNEVLKLYDGGHDGDDGATTTVNMTTLSDADQCQTLANQMKGAVLKQVGGAKVVGINFSARTTLEVREWPRGMPDFAHFEDEIYEGKSRSARVKESRKRELMRYAFPRPFALSSLPHKDISMQSVEEDDGEFRMYQGVWRMQPLPGCSPAGESAMRLTYAVEVSPRPYLPVALVEGRIAQDLCSNLKAIRNMFEESEGSNSS